MRKFENDQNQVSLSINEECQRKIKPKVVQNDRFAYSIKIYRFLNECNEIIFDNPKLQIKSFIPADCSVICNNSIIDGFLSLSFLRTANRTSLNWHLLSIESGLHVVANRVIELLLAKFGETGTKSK